MKNVTIPKSTSKKLKTGYEILVSVLIPVLLKRIGFPTVAVDAAEKAMSKTTDLLFRDKGFQEMMQDIIKESMKELLGEEEEGSPLYIFGNAIISDTVQFGVPDHTEDYADYFAEIYRKWDSEKATATAISPQELQSFANAFRNRVFHKIAQNDELEKYRLIVKTANGVDDLQQKLNNIETYLKTLQLPFDYNKEYRKKYFENLCLHREGNPVSLADIFVMPEVDAQGKRVPVGDCVKQFIANKEQNILLLLGYGGYGKTSFAARMAAYETKYTNGRPLHIFRLREFANASVETLCDEIKNKIKNFDKISDDAVLVFDGLDELCMIGGSRDETKKSLALLEKLALLQAEKPNSKMIITSRPNYISDTAARNVLVNMGIAAKKFISYTYHPFDEKQKTELVNRIERADPRLKDNIGCTRIRNGENTDDAIYGSPFILYLICAGDEKITKECFTNRWLLFRTVFHDIIPRPKHKSIKARNTQQGKVVRDHLDKLYRITCRLAYEMYKSGYKIPYFQKDDVGKIIQELFPNEEEELLKNLKDCYALCAYFRENEGGAVEFAHNHVRDFFLCEYILQELDGIYKNEGNLPPEQVGKAAADWMSNALKYSEIDVYKTEDEFMTGAALEFYRNAMENKAVSCPNILQNFKKEELRHVFNVYCKNGGLCAYRADDMQIGVRTAAKNAVRNAGRLFYCLLNSYSPSEEYIQWFDKDVFNGGEREIIEELQEYLVHADLRDANLIDADLRGADLRGANLSGAYLRVARGADLRDADLRGAYLIDVYLRYADLRGANLRGALYNNDTRFDNVIPPDFDPDKWGMKKV